MMFPILLTRSSFIICKTDWEDNLTFSLLQTLPPEEVIALRASGATDVVTAAVALLTQRIDRLSSLMRAGWVTVEVRPRTRPPKPQVDCGVKGKIYCCWPCTYTGLMSGGASDTLGLKCLITSHVLWLGPKTWG